MKQNLRWIFTLAVMGSLAGCAASVTTIVTGKTRPAIDANAVKLYSNAPSLFEDVALVSAAANSGWTDQGQIDNAIAGLKSKAAQLGANGVLIEGVGTQSGGGMAIPNGTGGFLYAPVESQMVKGRAIFVTQE